MATIVANLVSITEAKELLGRSDLVSTQRYIGRRPEDTKRAIAAIQASFVPAALPA